MVSAADEARGERKGGGEPAELGQPAVRLKEHRPKNAQQRMAAALVARNGGHAMMVEQPWMDARRSRSAARARQRATGTLFTAGHRGRALTEEGERDADGEEQHAHDAEELVKRVGGRVACDAQVVLQVP